jgi:hypothetical protein
LLARDEESEDDRDAAGEVENWGTSSEIILNGNGGLAAGDPGRMSMSWYGGHTNQSVLGIESVLNEAERGVAGGEENLERQKWVVHEVSSTLTLACPVLSLTLIMIHYVQHLENVQEPKRRLRLPW